MPRPPREGDDRPQPSATGARPPAPQRPPPRPRTGGGALPTLVVVGCSAGCWLVAAAAVVVVASAAAPLPLPPSGPCEAAGEDERRDLATSGAHRSLTSGAPSTLAFARPGRPSGLPLSLIHI